MDYRQTRSFATCSGFVPTSLTKRMGCGTKQTRSQFCDQSKESSPAGSTRWRICRNPQSSVAVLVQPRLPRWQIPKVRDAIRKILLDQPDKQSCCYQVRTINKRSSILPLMFSRRTALESPSGKAPAASQLPPVKQDDDDITRFMLRMGPLEFRL